MYNWLKLTEEAQEARLDYVWSDLDECLIFADIVETEYRAGNRRHASRTLDELDKIYFEMLRIFRQSEVLEADIEGQYESKFNRLRERLDVLGKYR